MSGMILLLIVLLLLLFVCYKTSYNNVLLTPQFLFVAGFLLSVGYGIFWVDQWEMDLSGLTILILAGGITLFVGVSIAYQYLIGKRVLQLDRKRSIVLHHTEVRKTLFVEKWKLVAFAAFQVIVMLLYVYFLMHLTDGDLSTAIYYYRHSNLFTEDKIALPRWLRIVRYLSVASGYVWGYMLSYSLVYKCKLHRPLLIINILLAIVNTMILGARSGVFQLLLAIMAQFYFLYREKNGSNKKIGLKRILLVIVFVGVLIFTFQIFGNILGRNSTRSFGEYLAIYLSAEIKNLDTFVRTGKFGADAYTCQTLIYVVNFLSGKFGLPEWSHELDLPFQYVNGLSLGNVATTFYAFMYDGGVPAVIFFTVLMAIISQAVYFKMIKSKSNPKYTINMNLIVYSYMIFIFVFSFFSNKFYEIIFSSTFIYYLISWMLLRLFIEKVRIKHTSNIQIRRGGYQPLSDVGWYRPVYAARMFLSFGSRGGAARCFG